ncbi:MAG: hypothetical protein ACHQDE_00385 [Acidimicrobiia bacterium]
MQDPRVERTVALGVIVLAASIGIALVSFHSDRSDSVSVSVAAAMVTTNAVTTTEVTATEVTAAPSTTTTAPDPGALPQTTEEPVADGDTFDTGVQGLWNAIVHDEPDLAMPFFFPKSAYLQVKAIQDPASDYEHRLIANFKQDVHALHAQLGANASAAHFDGIDVPSDQAVLVQPGEEYNKLQYWRVYGTTLRYTLDGTAGTLPVTSLISWRGEWYVVHLGAIR